MPALVITSSCCTTCKRVVSFIISCNLSPERSAYAWFLSLRPWGRVHGNLHQLDLTQLVLSSFFQTLQTKSPETENPSLITVKRPRLHSTYSFQCDIAAIMERSPYNPGLFALYGGYPTMLTKIIFNLSAPSRLLHPPHIFSNSDSTGYHRQLWRVIFFEIALLVCSH